MKTLKQLITESVNEYLREIEEAGNENAVIEKMKSCEEAIAVRERKINKEGIEEAMHDMIDPKKIKELQKEVKVIEKTLKKYQKQLEKLKSKNKHVGAEDTEDSTEEPEEIIDENEEFVPSGEVKLIPQLKKDYEDEDDDDEYDADGTPNEDGDFDSKGNPISSRAIDQAMHRGESDRDNMYLNESFLYMQKLAGLITEGQYNQKKRLIENQSNENTKHSELKPLEDILLKNGYKFAGDDIGFSDKATYKKEANKINTYEISLFKDYLEYPVRILYFVGEDYTFSNGKKMNRGEADIRYNSIDDAKKDIEGISKINTAEQI